MGTIAWTMTADVAMEFFKRCHERKAESEKERMVILAELAKEGQMTGVTVSKKSKDEYIAEKAKHFKVLKVEKKRETN